MEASDGGPGQLVGAWRQPRVLGAPGGVEAAAPAWLDPEPEPGAGGRPLPGPGERVSRARLAANALGLAVLTSMGVAGAALGVRAIEAGLVALCVGLALWRLALILTAPRSRSEPGDGPAGGAMPSFSLLCPLYREADVLPDLVERLTALAWPADRLEIILICEMDDGPSIAAARALAADERVKLVVAPPGLPRTKPRALNIGFAYATGALIGIYDAEDRPDPRQLLAVWRAFEGGDRPDFVQAPLSIDNAADSWLARQFALEYAIHFRCVGPALIRWGAPLALGGTSNFFRREALEGLGGWDAHNVTEDAELGMRLALAGKRAAFVRPPTHEEAPWRAAPWLRQRSRWLKGFMQTLAGLNRRPLAAARRLGWAGYLAAQLQLGGAVAAALLCAPLTALGLWRIAGGEHGWPLLVVGLAPLGAQIVGGARTMGWRGAVTALTSPLYWILASLAALRAVRDLAWRPDHWDKTQHGVSRLSRAEPPRPGAEGR